MGDSVNIPGLLKIHCNITTMEKLLLSNAKTQGLSFNWERRAIMKTETCQLKRESVNVYFPKLPEKLLSIMLLNGYRKTIIHAFKRRCLPFKRLTTEKSSI